MMSEDLKAIFSQFRRLDAMAQVAGGRINDQAAITKQMTQLLTALRKTKGNYQLSLEWHINLHLMKDMKE